MNVAEQAQLGAAGIDSQAGDSVSVPQEGAAEGGNGGKARTSQVDLSGKEEDNDET